MKQQNTSNESVNFKINKMSSGITGDIFDTQNR